MRQVHDHADPESLDAVEEVRPLTADLAEPDPAVHSRDLATSLNNPGSQ